MAGKSHGCGLWDETSSVCPPWLCCIMLFISELIIPGTGSNCSMPVRSGGPRICLIIEGLTTRAIRQNTTPERYVPVSCLLLVVFRQVVKYSLKLTHLFQLKYGFTPFLSSPSGCHPPLSIKRQLRNPFTRYHPYHTSSPELHDLLEWCPPPRENVGPDGEGMDVFPGQLPWRNQKRVGVGAGAGTDTRWDRERY